MSIISIAVNTPEAKKDKSKFVEKRNSSRKLIKNKQEEKKESKRKSDKDQHLKVSKIKDDIEFESQNLSDDSSSLSDEEDQV